MLPYGAVLIWLDGGSYMHGEIGAWIENSGWLKKTSARTPAPPRSIPSAIPSGILRSLGKKIRPPFQTKTKTPSTSSTRRSIFSPLFTSNLQSRLRDLPCNLRNSSPHFLPNFFLGLMLDSEIVFL